MKALLDRIYGMGEERAYDSFRRLRWPRTNGLAVCPKCGCLKTYEISTRHRFKCAACYAQFSATSGTIFASRKLPFTDLIAALELSSKPVSMLQICRALGIQYRTAFDLAHKIRDSGGQQWVKE